MVQSEQPEIKILLKKKISITAIPRISRMYILRISTCMVRLETVGSQTIGPNYQSETINSHHNQSINCIIRPQNIRNYT